MPQLEVHLVVEDAQDPVTYLVDGDLKRPGTAIDAAKSMAADDGYASAELEAVKLAEPV